MQIVFEKAPRLIKSSWFKCV